MARKNNLPINSEDNMLTVKGDNSRYLRHVMASWDLPPIDISDPKQVEDRIKWYFNHCAEDDMKPTVNGMCNALGVHRDTVCNWKNGDVRAATHQPIIAEAYKRIEEMWENYMMNGKINPVAGIFLGKVMFGYRDQQEIVVEAKNPINDYQDRKVIEAKYAELPED